MLPARLFEAKYSLRSRLPGTPSCISGSSGLKDLHSYQLSPLLLSGERGHVGAEQPPNLAWLSPHHQSQSINEWHYVYSTVVGFFCQDIARTDPGTLDAVCAVFLAVEMVEILI